MTELTSHLDQVKMICFGNKVKSLFAFGSITTDNFHEGSDVDLIVEISEEDPLTYSDIYFNLKSQLEQLFKRKIDLLEQKAIRNPSFKEQIEKTKVLLYGE
jgi:predicted nucleotidyltransferase